jgi:hypothetical protein
MQGTPAGLPSGMPGIGLEIDGAVQQAPQPGRQANGASLVISLFSSGGLQAGGPDVCIYLRHSAIGEIRQGGDRHVP